MDRFPESEFRVTLIWVDMLKSDTEPTAQRAAQAFRDPRVRHFHDPRRVVGSAFARDVFAGYLAKAAAILPEGDALRLHLEGRPVDAPLWDIYLFYGPGANWNTAPPQPSRWIKQMMLDRDGRSLIWENDFGRPPRTVDLMKEIELEAKEWLSPTAESTPRGEAADRVRPDGDR